MASQPLPKSGPITPMLWFDGVAEEAANLYVSVFPNSRITAVSRYSEAGQEVHGQPPGSAMVVAFELDGQPFTALNGGPQFEFTEAISLQISCETQEQIDWYWDRLSEGGDLAAQNCGWLKDRFGVSWQVTPTIIGEVLGGRGDPAAAARVTSAFMAMKKLDIAALEAAAGE